MNWLSAHKILNLGIVVAFIAMIIWLHDAFVQLSVKIMWAISYTNYDIWVAVIFLLITLGLAFFYYRAIRRNNSHIGLRITLLLLTLALIIAHSRIMFLFNIEVIHSIQFGLLAFLVFPLVRSNWQTLFIVTLVGYFDEWYQYMKLYPTITDYFDFNDVVMDQLGAAAVLVFLYNSGVSSNRIATWKSLFQTPRVWIGIGLVILVGILMTSGLIVGYAGEKMKHTVLVLNKSEAYEGFWHHVSMYARSYHILSPLEGFAANLLLIFGFGLLDAAPVIKSSSE